MRSATRYVRTTRTHRRRRRGSVPSGACTLAEVPHDPSPAGPDRPAKLTGYENVSPSPEPVGTSSGHVGCPKTFLIIVLDPRSLSVVVTDTTTSLPSHHVRRVSLMIPSTGPDESLSLDPPTFPSRKPDSLVEPVSRLPFFRPSPGLPRRPDGSYPRLKVHQSHPTPVGGGKSQTGVQGPYEVGFEDGGPGSCSRRSNLIGS